jgi:tetratricopeptide (TPR) repeat protein
MGRSLAPIGAIPAAEGDEAPGRTLFEVHGLEYAITRREGRVFHQETRRDSSGRILARNEAEVKFVLGSGSQGISYLVERDGFLFQSPISWYVQQKRWDLSPGYEKENPHFDRPVVSTCLFCHANWVEPVAGTVNRYRQPIFRGHAIGCERCHGPGELHVRSPLIVDGRDITIVNPAGLEPSLRNAVCEQCHLLGQRRVVKLDRRDEDFRPGLPFDRVWSVFVRTEGQGTARFVGQVEQMHESRCFRASGGRLGCTSCHDPHERPAPEHRVTYHRDRCLECHAERGCRLPAAARLAQSPDEDCAGCHMPRTRSGDVVHAAATDHRILRQTKDDSPDRLARGVGTPHRGEPPLVLFHRELMDDHQLALAERDLGLALSQSGPVDAAMALPLLERALNARPEDVAALEAKAFALKQLGRSAEALATFRAVLTEAPNRETAVVGAAFTAAEAGKRDDAITLWQRAIAIDPWRSDYRAQLGPLYFDARDWSAAAAACQETLDRNATDNQTRKLLVRCYLRLGNTEAARRAFQTLLGFNPADREELLLRFAPLARPR